MEAWVETPMVTYLGVVAYLLLCAMLYKKAMDAKPLSSKDNTLQV